MALLRARDPSDLASLAARGGNGIAAAVYVTKAMTSPSAPNLTGRSRKLRGNIDQPLKIIGSRKSAAKRTVQNIKIKRPAHRNHQSNELTVTGYQRYGR